jgi:transposase-like protein
MIGAKPNGEKELLVVEDGYRESAESWKTVLRELKRRGLTAPVMAVGDGALGSGPPPAKCGQRPALRAAGVTS